MCGRPVWPTLCVLLSTLCVSPWRQVAARTIAFCLGCLRAACDTSAATFSQELWQALSAALTKLTSVSMASSSQQNAVTKGETFSGPTETLELEGS